MKKSHGIWFLLFVVNVLMLSSCTKTVHDRRKLSTDTPDSRELFGCRINGVPYIPTSSGNASLGSCYYEAVYSGSSGFVFQINGERQESDCVSYSVGIMLDSVDLKRGSTYVLGSQTGRNFGYYFLTTACSQNRVELYTTDAYPGSVTITELDPEKHLVSGKFYFTVYDKDNRPYRMSDGIFDRHYTN